MKYFLKIILNKNKKNTLNSGFTFIETIIAIAIFVTISVSIIAGFSSILKAITIVRVKGLMSNMANEQFEIIRNLSYQNVGTLSGIPIGVIPQVQTIDRDNKNFEIQTTIRNFDDPFDGTFDGTPKDLSPADMKMIELTISCLSCEDPVTPLSFTTIVSPKNLETASVNGALVVRVFDSSGVPVPLANVNIINTLLTPNININDQTDINGMLTLVDAPPSVDGYHISVSKEGYSSDQTYPIGGTENPNPIKSDITVVVQQISQISFTIDRVSTINVTSLNSQCLVTPNFSYDVIGSKIIGTSPDTVKYSRSFNTNGSGVSTLSNMEWDTYNIIGTDSTYDIIGTNPLLSLGINPGVEQNMQIITTTKNGRRLLVVVRDSSTGLPVTDASVVLTGSGSYSNTKVTNEGFLSQSDWSSGDGQINYTNSSMFLDSDGNIDYTSSPGDIKLLNSLGSYASNGYITSSTFDTGVSSNFKQLVWSPFSQPVSTGVNSIRMKIATNNDNATWNFLGPDGTSSTYYTASDQNINSIHSGDRYIRYRIYLSTEDQAFSPTISDVSFTYSSACVPPGQVNFSGLQAGEYEITVDKDGYQTGVGTINISNNWSKKEIELTP